jgi:hypothetical protein
MVIHPSMPLKKVVSSIYAHGDVAACGQGAYNVSATGFHGRGRLILQAELAEFLDASSN